MKSVLISIRPNWCEKIASGKKTIEIRKTAPKETPFKAYIYCTKQKVNGEILLTYDKKVEGRNRGFRDKGDIPLAGKVIGEFICDKVEVLFNTNGNPENYMTEILPTILQKTALSYDEFAEYVGSRADKNSIYGWHISDLKIYDKPRDLSEFVGVNKNPYRFGGDFSCEFLSRYKAITRPPQSWQYVEEL